MKHNEPSKPPFHRKNHYVPRLYLKRWATPQQRIWTYRTLVSHSRIRLWQEHSTEGVAYHEHLYTQIIAGDEVDSLERWLDSEFETPAEEAIYKATSDKRLTAGDWFHLIRFFAAQDVRTPARLAANIRRWENDLPGFLENSMKRTVDKLEAAKKSGTVPVRQHEPAIDSANFPLKVTIVESEPDQEMGSVKAEIVAGRALWLAPIKYLLTKSAKVLHQHRWTILSPPDGLSWFTSDDPVIRLNYYRDGRYDFDGGWVNKGTYLLLPLGPRHLLYTEVGKRPPSRGEVIPQAKLIRRFIAEHADRMIFAAEPDAEMSELRPRLVDAVRFREENEQWRRWHEEQSEAERKLMRRS